MKRKQMISFFIATTMIAGNVPTFALDGPENIDPNVSNQENNVEDVYNENEINDQSEESEAEHEEALPEEDEVLNENDLPESEKAEDTVDEPALEEFPAQDEEIIEADDETPNGDDGSIVDELPSDENEDLEEDTIEKDETQEQVPEETLPEVPKEEVLPELPVEDVLPELPVEDVLPDMALEDMFIIQNGTLYGFSDEYYESGLNLEDIIIPEGVVTIAQDAFFGSSIRTVTFPSTLKTVDKQAFMNCIDLEEVIFNDGLDTIGEYAFAMTNLTSIDLPSSTKVIKKYAFTLCETLSDVYLNEGLRTLGDGAFSLTAIESLTIPGTLSKIGNFAFDSCDRLVNVIINEGVKTIGANAFQNTPIRSIDLPSTIVEVQKNAFINTEKLSEINLNNGLKSVGESSFENTAVQSINIPGTVNRIEKYAFASNDQLREVTLNEGTTVIQIGAFKGASFSEIVLPATIKEIRDYAFAENSSLQTVVNYSKKPQTVGADIFSGSMPEILSFPENSTFNDKVADAGTPVLLPTITNVSMSPDDRYAQEVVIDVTIENAEALDFDFISFDGGYSWTSEISKMYDYNTNVNILVKDKFGIICDKLDLVVGSIDRSAPVIESVTTSTEKFSQSVTLTIHATDDLKLAEKPYSFDGGLTWQESNEKTFTENEALSILVKDEALNISEIYSYTLDNVDTEAPVIHEIIPSATDISQKVTLTIVASDNSKLAEKPYSFDGGISWQESNEKVFEHNEFVTMMVKDEAENISIISEYDIENIDDIQPEVTSVNIQFINQTLDPDEQTISPEGTFSLRVADQIETITVEYSEAVFLTNGMNEGFVYSNRQSEDSEYFGTFKISEDGSALIIAPTAENRVVKTEGDMTFTIKEADLMDHVGNFNNENILKANVLEMITEGTIRTLEDIHTVLRNPNISTLKIADDSVLYLGDESVFTTDGRNLTILLDSHSKIEAEEGATLHINNLTFAADKEMGSTKPIIDLSKAAKVYVEQNVFENVTLELGIDIEAHVLNNKWIMTDSDKSISAITVQGPISNTTINGRLMKTTIDCIQGVPEFLAGNIFIGEEGVESNRLNYRIIGYYDDYGQIMNPIITPVVQSAELLVRKVTLEFDGTVVGNLESSDFTIKVNSKVANIVSSELNDHTITFTLDKNVMPGTLAEITYSGTQLMDLADNLIQPFNMDLRNKAVMIFVDGPSSIKRGENVQFSAIRGDLSIPENVEWTIDGGDDSVSIDENGFLTTDVYSELDFITIYAKTANGEIGSKFMAFNGMIDIIAPTPTDVTVIGDSIELVFDEEIVGEINPEDFYLSYNGKKVQVLEATYEKNVANLVLEKVIPAGTVTELHYTGDSLSDEALNTVAQFSKIVTNKGKQLFIDGLRVVKKDQRTSYKAMKGDLSEVKDITWKIEDGDGNIYIDEKGNVYLEVFTESEWFTITATTPDGYVGSFFVEIKGIYDYIAPVMLSGEGFATNYVAHLDEPIFGDCNVDMFNVFVDGKLVKMNEISIRDNDLIFKLEKNVRAGAIVELSYHGDSIKDETGNKLEHFREQVSNKGVNLFIDGQGTLRRGDTIQFRAVQADNTPATNVTWVTEDNVLATVTEDGLVNVSIDSEETYFTLFAIADGNQIGYKFIDIKGEKDLIDPVLMSGEGYGRSLVLTVSENVVGQIDLEDIVVKVNNKTVKAISVIQEDDKIYIELEKTIVAGATISVDYLGNRLTDPEGNIMAAKTIDVSNKAVNLFIEGQSTLRRGDTIQFKATEGTGKPATNVTWLIEDNDLVTVTEDGLVNVSIDSGETYFTLIAIADGKQVGSKFISIQGEKDLIDPVLMGGEGYGRNLTLQISETVDGTIDLDEIIVKVNNKVVKATSVSQEEDKISIELDKTIVAGAVISVEYLGDNLKDAEGNAMGKKTIDVSNKAVNLFIEGQATLRRGDTIQFKAVQGNAQLAENVTWFIEDNDLVTVTENGLVNVSINSDETYFTLIAIADGKQVGAKFISIQGEKDLIDPVLMSGEGYGRDLTLQVSEMVVGEISLEDIVVRVNNKVVKALDVSQADDQIAIKLEKTIVAGATISIDYLGNRLTDPEGNIMAAKTIDVSNKAVNLFIEGQATLRRGDTIQFKATQGNGKPAENVVWMIEDNDLTTVTEDGLVNVSIDSEETYFTLIAIADGKQVGVKFIDIKGEKDLIDPVLMGGEGYGRNLILAISEDVVGTIDKEDLIVKVNNKVVEVKSVNQANNEIMIELNKTIVAGATISVDYLGNRLTDPEGNIMAAKTIDVSNKAVNLFIEGQASLRRGDTIQFKAVQGSNQLAENVIWLVEDNDLVTVTEDGLVNVSINSDETYFTLIAIADGKQVGAKFISIQGEKDLIDPELLSGEGYGRNLTLQISETVDGSIELDEIIVKVNNKVVKATSVSQLGDQISIELEKTIVAGATISVQYLGSNLKDAEGNAMNHATIDVSNKAVNLFIEGQSTLRRGDTIQFKATEGTGKPATNVTWLIEDNDLVTVKEDGLVNVSIDSPETYFTLIAIADGKQVGTKFISIKGEKDLIDPELLSGEGYGKNLILTISETVEGNIDLSDVIVKINNKIVSVNKITQENNEIFIETDKVIVAGATISVDYLGNRLTDAEGNVMGAKTIDVSNKAVNLFIEGQATLRRGDTIQFKATQGNAKPATNVEWIVEDNEMVTVDENGLVNVSINSEETYFTLIAIADGKQVGSKFVTIKGEKDLIDPELLGGEGYGRSLTLQISETVDGSINLDEIIVKVNNKVVKANSVSQLDSQIIIELEKTIVAGATISVEYLGENLKDAEGNAMTHATIDVSNKAVNLFIEGQATLRRGDTIQFKATEGTGKPATNVTWFVEDNSLVTVTENGLVNVSIDSDETYFTLIAIADGKQVGSKFISIKGEKDLIDPVLMSGEGYGRSLTLQISEIVEGSIELDEIIVKVNDKIAKATSVNQSGDQITIELEKTIVAGATISVEYVGSNLKDAEGNAMGSKTINVSNKGVNMFIEGQSTLRRGDTIQFKATQGTGKPATNVTWIVEDNDLVTVTEDGLVNVSINSEETYFTLIAIADGKQVGSKFVSIQGEKDLIDPVLMGGEGYGRSLILQISETVEGSIELDEIIVKVNNKIVKATSVSQLDSQITIELEKTIVAGATISVEYLGSSLKDAEGNAMGAKTIDVSNKAVNLFIEGQATLRRGDTIQFKAIQGSNQPAENITWFVEDNDLVTVTEDGLVNVSIDSPETYFTLIAIADGKQVGSKFVSIKGEKDLIDPELLGGEGYGRSLTLQISETVEGSINLDEIIVKVNNKIVKATSVSQLGDQITIELEKTIVAGATISVEYLGENLKDAEGNAMNFATVDVSNKAVNLFIEGQSTLRRGDTIQFKATQGNAKPATNVTWFVEDNDLVTVTEDGLVNVSIDSAETYFTLIAIADGKQVGTKLVTIEGEKDLINPELLSGEGYGRNLTLQISETVEGSINLDEIIVKVNNKVVKATSVSQSEDQITIELEKTIVAGATISVEYLGSSLKDAEGNAMTHATIDVSNKAVNLFIEGQASLRRGDTIQFKATQGNAKPATNVTWFVEDNNLVTVTEDGLVNVSINSEETYFTLIAIADGKQVGSKFVSIKGEKDLINPELLNGEGYGRNLTLQISETVEGSINLDEIIVKVNNKVVKATAVNQLEDQITIELEKTIVAGATISIEYLGSSLKDAEGNAMTHAIIDVSNKAVNLFIEGQATLRRGDTIQFKATEGTGKPATNVTWIVEDNDLVTVNEDGVVNVSIDSDETYFTLVAIADGKQVGTKFVSIKGEKDLINPELLSGEGYGRSLILQISETVDGSINLDEIIVKVNNKVVKANSVSQLDSQIIIELEKTIVAGATISVEYLGENLKDAEGNAMTHVTIDVSNKAVNLFIEGQATLRRGDTIQFKATQANNTAAANVTWFVEDNDLVSVSKDGIVNVSIDSEETYFTLVAIADGKQVGTKFISIKGEKDLVNPEILNGEGSGKEFVLTLSEKVKGSLSKEDLTIKVNGKKVEIKDTYQVDDKISVTLEKAILAGATISIEYIGDGLTDDEGNIMAAQSINVSNKAVNLFIEGQTTLRKGDTIQFKATQGDLKPASNVAWFVEDNDLVTVTEDGIVNVSIDSEETYFTLIAIADGHQVGSKFVTIKGEKDLISPEIVKGEGHGRSLTLILSEKVSGSIDLEDLIVKVNDKVAIIKEVSLEDSKVIISLEKTILPGASISIDYKGNRLTDAEDNKMNAQSIDVSNKAVNLFIEGQTTLRRGDTIQFKATQGTNQPAGNVSWFVEDNNLVTVDADGIVNVSIDSDETYFTLIAIADGQQVGSKFVTIKGEKDLINPEIISGEGYGKTFSLTLSENVKGSITKEDLIVNVNNKVVSINEVTQANNEITIKLDKTILAGATVSIEYIGHDLKDEEGNTLEVKHLDISNKAVNLFIEGQSTLRKGDTIQFKATQGSNTAATNVSWLVEDNDLVTVSEDGIVNVSIDSEETYFTLIAIADGKQVGSKFITIKGEKDLINPEILAGEGYGRELVLTLSEKVNGSLSKEDIVVNVNNKIVTVREVSYSNNEITIELDKTILAGATISVEYVGNSLKDAEGNILEASKIDVSNKAVNLFIEGQTTLRRGDTIQFKATQGNNQTATNVTWFIEDNELVSVDENGLVNVSIGSEETYFTLIAIADGKQVGSKFITIKGEKDLINPEILTGEGYGRSLVLTLSEEVKGSLTKEDIVVKVNNKIMIVSEVSYANNEMMIALEKTIVAGATISVEYSGNGLSDSEGNLLKAKHLDVANKAVNLFIEGQTTLRRGDTIQFKATQGTGKPATNVTWLVEDNDLVTVDENGIVNVSIDSEETYFTLIAIADGKQVGTKFVSIQGEKDLINPEIINGEGHGKTLTLTLSENVMGSLEKEDLLVKVNNKLVTISDATHDNNEIIIHLEKVITAGATISVEYLGNSLKDQEGNKLEAKHLDVSNKAVNLFIEGQSTLRRGDAYQFKATQGDLKPATNITWSVEDNDLVTVSEDGLVNISIDSEETYFTLVAIADGKQVGTKFITIKGEKDLINPEIIGAEGYGRELTLTLSEKVTGEITENDMVIKVNNKIASISSLVQFNNQIIISLEKTVAAGSTISAEYLGDSLKDEEGNLLQATKVDISNKAVNLFIEGQTTLRKGDVAQFKATQANNTAATNVTWFVEDNALVTVTEDGIVNVSIDSEETFFTLIAIADGKQVGSKFITIKGEKDLISPEIISSEGYGKELVLTLSENVTGDINEKDVVVKVNNKEAVISSITQENNEIIVTMEKAITAGATISIEYLGHSLKDEEGNLLETVKMDVFNKAVNLFIEGQATLRRGDAIQFKATQGNAKPATNVTWFVEDNDLVSVDENGVVNVSIDSEETYFTLIAIADGKQVGSKFITIKGEKDLLNPEIISGEGYGRSLTLTLSEEIKGSISLEDIVVRVNNQLAQVSDVSYLNNEITIKLEKTITAGQTISIEYLGNNLSDLEENPLKTSKIDVSNKAVNLFLEGQSTLRRGDVVQFKATQGDNQPAQNVSWFIEDNNFVTVDYRGVVNVSIDSEETYFTLIAIADGQQVGTKFVTIKGEKDLVNPEITSAEGYGRHLELTLSENVQGTINQEDLIVKVNNKVVEIKSVNHNNNTLSIELKKVVAAGSSVSVEYLGDNLKDAEGNALEAVAVGVMNRGINLFIEGQTSLRRGDTIQFKATQGDLKPASNIAWIVEDNEMVTVDENGFVTVSINSEETYFTLTAVADGYQVGTKFVMIKGEKDLIHPEIISGEGFGRNITLSLSETIEGNIAKEDILIYVNNKPVSVSDVTYVNNEITINLEKTVAPGATISANYVGNDLRDMEGNSLLSTKLDVTNKGINLFIEGPSVLRIGDVSQFKATQADTNPAENVTWIVEDNGLVSVDQSGNVVVSNDAKETYFTLIAIADGKQVGSKFITISGQKDIIAPEFINAEGYGKELVLTLSEVVEGEITKEDIVVKVNNKAASVIDLVQVNNEIIIKLDQAIVAGATISVEYLGSRLSDAEGNKLSTKHLDVSNKGVNLFIEGQTSIRRGDTIQFKATQGDANPAANVSWSIEGSRHVTVNQDGFVTVEMTAAETYFTLVAIADGKQVGSKFVTINGEKDIINPEFLNGEGYGRTLTLKLSEKVEGALEKEDIIVSVNNKVVSLSEVHQSGNEIIIQLEKTIPAGATISVSYNGENLKDAEGNILEATKLDVANKAVNLFIEGQTTLKRGESIQFKATQGNNTPATNVLWFVEDNDLVTVNEDGLVSVSNEATETYFTLIAIADGKQVGTKFIGINGVIEEEAPEEIPEVSPEVPAEEPKEETDGELEETPSEDEIQEPEEVVEEDFIYDSNIFETSTLEEIFDEALIEKETSHLIQTMEYDEDTFTKEKLPVLKTESILEKEEEKEDTWRSDEQIFVNVKDKDGNITKYVYNKTPYHTPLEAPAVEIAEPVVEYIGYSDVSESYWGYSAIKEATLLGYLSGTGDNKFNPKEKLTLIDTFTALDRVVLGNSIQAPKIEEDVIKLLLSNFKQNHWGYDAFKSVISVLPLEECVKLTEDKESIYQNDMTRGDMAKYIYLTTKDVTGIEANSAIEYCQQTGIMIGDNKGNFNENKVLTRVELACIINRLFAILH